MHEEKSDEIRPQVTIEDVLAFVARCPRLISLGILFDASTVKVMKEPFPLSAQETRHLAALDVGHSWITPEATRSVAAVIAQYFPALKRLSWHDLDDRHILTPSDRLLGRPCLHDGEVAYRRCADWHIVLNHLPFHVDHVSGHWWGSEI